MIDQLTELTNKTNELELTIQNITEKQKVDEGQTNSISFSRNFSSLEIIMPKRIFVAKIEPKQNSNILFQCQLDLTLTASENVEISFIVNGFVIYKTYKILPVGSNQISIMQNFKPIDDSKFSVYVEITPVTQKPVVLNNISLFAWGNLNGDYQIDYQAIDLGSKYLLSMNESNCIYAIQTDKEISEFNLSDLNYINNGLSHSFVYDEENNIIYLFRVDLNGNLFYSNFENGYEIFLVSDVTSVSADISDSGKMLVTYIKNNECYYFEISENHSISSHRKLFVNSILVRKCLCYYNSLRNKFLLILSSSNDNNYLVEQINENFSNSDTVTAEYGFYITTTNNI